MSGKLVLIRAEDKLGAFRPAALYEKAAARYIKIDIATFRELVRAGVIPARSHAGRRRNIYFIEDLDGYLRNLPVKTVSDRIGPGETLSKPLSEKGGLE